MLSPKSYPSLRKHLLAWFDVHQRDLPWRKAKTPYRIWISEIMLQQTQVATVIDYYIRFMKQFPTVEKLAAADEADVLKLWEGLGYYRRARQLHAAAKLVVANHKGKFPETFDEVLALPGIGRYTAGAILSISKDQRLPILEGNTIRLFARLMEMRSDPKTTANQKALWEFSQALLPKERCGDFNQALMEVGNQVCSPKRPKCLICPIRDLCPTAIKGLQEQIPAASKKMKYEDLHEAVVIVRRKNKLLIRQSQAGERWENLWDFLRFEIKTKVAKKNRLQGEMLAVTLEQLTENVKAMTGLQVSISSTDIRIKHAVTRFRITLDCFVTGSVTGRMKRMPAATQWVTLSQIADIPMSMTGRKIAGQLTDLE